MEKTTKFKVEDYGDMLAKVFNADLVAYQRYGSYQGTYLAVLDENGTYKFYVDYYGSCSGCDWLESEKDWDTGEVDYKDALEYCQKVKLKYAMPKELWQSLSNEQKRMLVIDEYEKEEMSEEIIKF